MIKSATTVEDSDEDQSDGKLGNNTDVEMEDGTQVGVHVIDIAAQRAMFLFNRVNLLSPPLKMKFGEWNDRPLMVKHAKELLETMKSQDI